MKIPQTKHTIRGPLGLRVDLDPSQCIPGDPGSGTPIVIHLAYFDACEDRIVHASCTWGAYDETGLIDWYTPSPRQRAWLDGLAGDLSDWLSDAFCGTGGAR